MYKLNPSKHEYNVIMNGLDNHDKTPVDIVSEVTRIISDIIVFAAFRLDLCRARSVDI